MERILVIDDDRAVTDALQRGLGLAGFTVDAANSGETGLALYRDNDPQLIILDVMMPGLNGLEVLQRIRQVDARLPILMLTARGSEDDVLRGFRAGADDYVTKPFSIAELVARVEALLRRSGKLERLRVAPFAFGPFHVDPEERTATREGESLDLTRREVEMLALFVRERGRIVSRRALLQEVWEIESADRIETRTVDMHIAKLRRKLGDERRGLIATVRGEGYRFA